MTPQLTKHLLLSAIFSLAPWSVGWAQVAAPVPVASSTASVSPQDATQASFDRAINDGGNWYFSWGFSRQQYAPSDIHVSQPGLGNDFTVRQARASDFPASLEDTITSTLKLELTNPQENVRIGKFLNPEKTFAIEFSIDHSKYNTDFGQTVALEGTINNVPQNGNTMVLTPQNFNYALHNGLNHLMVNAVWLHHLYGPSQQPGHLQSISRVGAGILLPHADNKILGNENQVGPKNEKICCGSGDWWQINGWTAGVEVGLRYTIYKSVYLELTQKFAYGALSRVPVYQGHADQTIWMSEQVLSTGFRF
jgi:hypothetical protein